MHTRTLGHNGPRVSALGLGCMGMSDFYSRSGDDNSAVATLDRALELGVTLFDTADMYGPYSNEQLLGRWLKGRREQVFIASKFGIVRTEDPHARGVNGRPDYVRQSLEGSLQRLGVERIDLYYQHRVDPNVPVEETFGALAELVREGKLGHLGICEARASTIERAHATHPLAAVQSEYSLWSREPEQDGVLATCRRLGIAFVPYSPLGRGFLSGRFHSPEDFAADDYRRHSPRFQGENFTRNLALVEQVEALAAARGVSAAQLALAWVLGQGDDIVPIPGTTRVENLEANLGALAIQLSAAERGQLDAIFPVTGAAAGERYGVEAMRTLDR
ncbi:aldo/keto reductase [Pseudomonas sp. KNUC1026]|uniref:aldo/keto reductase n=1 Tax=Pseudomonas sp. KNUC1026 TaxID=2893890 RepID=UPI001F48F51D|nr:aldo/keto reductase [Pseudomonas sp. KNUC1026]UFH51490.1 aldo/keto reductase [Pseudomonas sp. KNUC1026]